MLACWWNALEIDVTTLGLHNGACLIDEYFILFGIDVQQFCGTSCSMKMLGLGMGFFIKSNNLNL